MKQETTGKQFAESADKVITVTRNQTKEIDVKKLIVTFDCHNNVNVYNAKSGVKPRLPYRTHSTEEDAVNYLKENRGIDNPKIVYYEF
jgi:hypothetical protein